ncbi:MAG TPA: hypothetical protein VIZ68_04720 [Thermoplasmata archaeon]
MIGAAVIVAFWVAWGVWFPWRQDPATGIVWGTVFAGVTLLNGYYAVRMWIGKADPEPLPPGPYDSR